MAFDFERRRLSVVVERGDKCLLITKGAPEGVLRCCSRYEELIELNASARAQCEAAFQKLSADGYRVLAVAYKQAVAQAVYRAEDETDLILAGFLAFSDSPPEEMADVMRALRRDGVELKILTGDGKQVAHRVCEQVGLDVKRVVLGDEIGRLTAPALAQVVEEHTVFARVSPAQKHRRACSASCRCRRSISSFSAARRRRIWSWSSWSTGA